MADWKNTLLTRISNLLTVKSIITILLSALFVVLAIRGVIEGKDVLQIYMIITAFYFGTQHEKQTNAENLNK